MRTSSATDVGDGKDSERRQRAAIEGYASASGYKIVDWFYDAAVRGADPVTARPGFSAMLDRIDGNGVRTIIVESPDRFARDLAVQLAGHDYLKELGVMLVPASAPDFFVEDTPTAVLVRQVLGAIAQFDKATTVAKLRAARDRKRKQWAWIIEVHRFLIKLWLSLSDGLPIIRRMSGGVGCAESRSTRPPRNFLRLQST